MSTTFWHWKLPFTHYTMKSSANLSYKEANLKRIPIWEKEKERVLTVKIAGKWSGKVNILRACPRHYVFSVSQKSPKISSLTTPMALPAPTQLPYFTPTNFNLNSQFHSLRFKIEIAERKKPPKPNRSGRVERENLW